VAKNEFYEVKHRGHCAGYFRTRKAAERCASEFKTNIEGQSYPVEIVERVFLDEQYKEDEKDDFNWGVWNNDDCGGV
jgi:hypothetical protein